MIFDEARAVRISTLFSKVCKPTERTGLWNTLPKALQSVAEEVSLNEAEKPLVLSVKTPQVWCCLTTRRLVWMDEGLTRSIDYEAIHHAKCGLQDLVERRNASLGEPPLLDFWDRLVVETYDGTVWTIRMEEGKGPVTGTIKALNAVCHDLKRSATSGPS